MKISNETKIGTLAVVGIAIFILGFNFLKGNRFLKKEKYIYAVFEDIQGLGKANPVVINGLQIGHVASLDGGKDIRRILVTVDLTQDIVIPKNSLAVINPSLLGSVSLEIKLGNSQEILKTGDTLLTTLSGGAFDEALKMINPVLYEVRNAVKSLDSVLHVVSGVFDPVTKNNIKSTVENLNSVTGSFVVSASALQALLNKDGYLNKSMENANAFTTNLISNNGKLNNILTNAEKASATFSNINLQKTLTTLDSAATQLQSGIAKINTNNGSLGLLLNDTKVYDNLNATSNKINILLDDIRVHPKRYISISVFGKKDKGNYLTAPLVDDTLKVSAKTP